MKIINGQEHWSPEDYKKYKEKKKINKYKNKKCEADGIIFGSEKEKEYYEMLVVLKKAGEIIDFELQPSFVLQEGFTKNGVRYQSIVYIADFKVLKNDERFEIIDVKGFQTAVFKIKRKLFEYRYPELELIII